MKKRRFICFVHYNPYNISLGISIDWCSPNLEIHFPFGFAKIGWEMNLNYKYFDNTTWGILP